MGFFARFHVSLIREKPGSSWETGNPASTADLAKLQRLVRAMLRLHRQRLANDRTSRIELSISDDARSWWAELCQQVRCLAEGELARIDEYVDKMLGLTIRVACLLHVFESRSRVVSLSALQRAWCLVRHSADDYMSVFAPPPPMPQREQDYVAVDAILRKHSNLLGAVPCIKEIAALLEIPEKRVLAALLRRQALGLCYVDPKRGTIGSRILPIFSGTRWK